MQILLYLLALVAIASAALQKVTVKGTVICDKRRYKNVTIELWERDRFDPNDLMATVKTNGEGDFEVTGSEKEVTKIEPFLRITHKCKVKNQKCNRITEYEIPSSYIDGATYDMTYINLDIISAVDKEKC